MKSLIVELPGLLQNTFATRASNPICSLNLPHLSRLLSKADKSSLVSCGLQSLAQYEITGAICAKYAFSELSISEAVINSYKYWFRADPMQLLVDISTVHLKGNRHFELSKSQLDCLQLKVKKCIEYLDAEYILISATEGYFGCNEKPEVNFTAPLQALGENQAKVMPKGSDSGYWQGIITEIQMSLFGRAEPLSNVDSSTPVNSIHFWGDSKPISTDLKLDYLISDSNLLRGFASSQKIKSSATEGVNLTNLSKLKQASQRVQIVEMELLWLQRQGLNSMWLNKLMQIESNLLKAIEPALKANLLTDVYIITDDVRCFHLTKNHFNKFWKRTKSVEFFLEDKTH